jgi:co-chaperonin GroES (HSP10)
MKIEDFLPTFHNVWIKEERPEKTASGLFIPERGFQVKTYSDMFENEKEHTVEDIGTVYFTVVSTGPGCTQNLKPGEQIILMNGARREKLENFDGSYWSVSEQQIIGRIKPVAALNT